MAEDTEPADPSASANRGRSRKTAALIAGAVAIAGLGAWGVIAGATRPETAAKANTATAHVTYSVTGKGTVDITYRGTGRSDTATTVHAATLPWTSDVRLAAGAEPIVQIVLRSKDSEAGCTLTVNGQHVQSSNAAGEFQRATCTAAAITSDIAAPAGQPSQAQQP